MVLIFVVFVVVGSNLFGIRLPCPFQNSISHIYTLTVHVINKMKDIIQTALESRWNRMSKKFC